MENTYYEIVEVCPYCENENVYPMLNIEENGYITTCQHCGSQIFLCDECLHSEDNECSNCNWHEENGYSVCMRGKYKIQEV